jgi:fructosamine-3-kinase
VTVPTGLAATASAALGRTVTGGRAVRGGDLNDGWLLELDGDLRAFVKTRHGAAAGEFATEAAGLRWLAEPAALVVPEVLAVVDPEEDTGGERLLALAWIDEGRLDEAGAEALGRGLAELHAAGAPAFGAAPPGAPAGDASPLRLGPLTLPNEPAETWAAFYRANRLEPTARLAEQRGALDADGLAAVDRVAERLEDLAGPEEPPARLHGDLWSGNVLADASGRPVLIDPAAHGGHREMDLAMLRLFGGPSERVHSAYAETAPLAAGHEDRVELWQLFPLLVHAALFGGSYGSSVVKIARRYGG